MKARHDEGKLYPRITKAEADLVRGACPETNEAEAEVMEGAGNREKLVRLVGGEASDDEADSEEEGGGCLVCGVEGGGEGESEEGGEESDEEGERVVVEEPRAEEVERIRAVKDERRVKELVDPRRPTRKEVEEHERTHLPYRN